MTAGQFQISHLDQTEKKKEMRRQELEYRKKRLNHMVTASDREPSRRICLGFVDTVPFDPDQKKRPLDRRSRTFRTRHNPYPPTAQRVEPEPVPLPRKEMVTPPFPGGEQTCEPEGRNLSCTKKCVLSKRLQLQECRLHHTFDF
jgi:hypothetical protein